MAWRLLLWPWMLRMRPENVFFSPKFAHFIVYSRTFLKSYFEHCVCINIHTSWTKVCIHSKENTCHMYIHVHKQAHTHTHTHTHRNRKQKGEVPTVYLAKRAIGEHTHVSWVLNGSNNPSSNQQLLPSLTQIENGCT